MSWETCSEARVEYSCIRDWQIVSWPRMEKSPSLIFTCYIVRSSYLNVAIIPLDRSVNSRQAGSFGGGGVWYQISKSTVPLVYFSILYIGRETKI